MEKWRRGGYNRCGGLSGVEVIVGAAEREHGDGGGVRGRKKQRGRREEREREAE